MVRSAWDHLDAAAMGVGDEGPGISSEQAEHRKPGVEAGTDFASLEGGDDEIGEERVTGKRPRVPDLLADERWRQGHQTERPEAG